MSTADLIKTYWGLDGIVLEPLAGGMNSETSLVHHAGSTFVVKRVPLRSAADLAAGCEVAANFADAGFVTGRPVPTIGGQLLQADEGLALLELVPGHELDGETATDQRLMGETLAGIHATGSPSSRGEAAGFMSDWLTSEAPGSEDHPWLLRGIETARSETDDLELAWSVLHTDPAPEAFIHDTSTGVTGLVDWAGARPGPVLYDVASAVMYLGGTDHAAAFLDAYRCGAPFVAGQMHHLDALRRFREVIQGVYFARRLALRDLTDGIDAAENQKGLDDARRRLANLASGER